MYKTDVPCEQLDVKTRLCAVYDTRFLENPMCSTLVEALARQVVPSDCPYARMIPDYFGPLPFEMMPGEDETS